MNKKEHPQLDLTTSPIGQSLRQLFIPASIGFFFNVLFNVVDTYFGGTISPQSIAALSVTFPLFFIILAPSFGFASSTSALIATQIGKKQKKEAQILYFQGLSFGILITILVMVIGILLSKSMLIFLGAGGPYLQEALNYILPLFYGSFFLIQVQLSNSALSALGLNKPFRNFFIASFFANIVLDYWFVKGGLGLPPLGITGIALATVFVHIGGIIYIFFNVRKTFFLENIDIRDFIPRKDCFLQILSQGIPSTFNMMSISFYFFVINRFVADFGQEAIAAYGIGLRIEQLILVPGIGLGIAITTMVAQNHGANLEDRVRKIIKVGMIYSLVIMVFGCLFLWFASEQIIRFFTQDEKIIQIGITYLKIEAFTLFSYSLMHISSASLQGLKKPNISSMINLVGRFSPIPILLVLINVLNYGSTAIWWTILFNSWAMGIIFLLSLMWCLNKTFPS